MISCCGTCWWLGWANFLQIHELNHSVVGQTSFRVEYKRSSSGASGVFSRGVRMQVDIIASQHCIPSSTPTAPSPDVPTYVIQFTLVAGAVCAVEANLLKINIWFGDFVAGISAKECLVYSM